MQAPVLTGAQAQAMPARPRHVAIIMDGNGRWASQRGLPRLLGHRAGTKNVRSIISAAIARGIGYLTLYVFSTENWGRPAYEVKGLMSLLGEAIGREVAGLHREGVQLRHLGRGDNLPDVLRRRIDRAVDLTRANSAITVMIALNYGGRADIIDAMRAIVAQGIPPQQIDEDCVATYLGTSGIPDPDLIIRTGGEQRFSNFLLWQAAYSEYWTTPVLWPDFTPEHLDGALGDYERRDRRFGSVPRVLNQLTE